jgi:NTP pyrophosphatase (non-canonical NTP hydrolase)
MTDIEEIRLALLKFRNDRDWSQFHNAKDLAIALSIESNELLELFLWKQPEDADRVKIKQELADVLSYAILLAEKLNIDIKESILEKIAQNEKKYPIEKSKGNAKKYNEL